MVLFPEHRPHADGKLVDLYAAELRRQEVTQLMHGDEHAENQDRRQDVDKAHECLLANADFTASRAAWSADKISSNEGVCVTGTAARAAATRSEMS